MERSNPTQVEQEVGELRLAVAQTVEALRVTVGWRPEGHGQETLAAIVLDAQARHAELVADGLERRPEMAPETREAAA